MSPWLWSAGAMLAAALAMMVWSYRRAARLQVSGLTFGMATVAFAFKALGIGVLALCLIEPLWSGRRATPGANLFVVLADNSSGMNIHDRDGAVSRGQILQGLLGVSASLETAPSGSKWLDALTNDFQVRSYMFDSRLHRMTNFSELAFDGPATHLGAAMRTLAGRFGDMPLAGILLLTDGCATDIGQEIHDLPDLPPVYPVVIGEGGTWKDISLLNVSVSQTAFEDAPVTIQAQIQAAGFAGRTLAVDLLDESGALIERQQWNVGGNDGRRTFRFRLRPDRTGVLFYRLRATQAPRGVSPSDATASSEATPANNEQTIVVDRGKGPYRILYVAGRPNWEYKFLRRAVEEDEQVQLVGLLRVARREPKYDWRGRVGETSNPLYRGFDARDEEAEQYDQPVLVRLNTRDKDELANGFPRTGEELFAYHAVILDDVEAKFFTRDQMDLLYRFVAERGGGFLMLGGKESFLEGSFRRTPIGNLLPVYLESAVSEAAPVQVRLQLTREGWLEPWARLRDNETEEQQRLSAMPEFRVVNRTGSAKPGAKVVNALGGDEQRQLPALAGQRLGNGRTAALVVGDIWRWGMQNPQMRDDMEKFWRQTLRWLVTDVPGRISLQTVQKLDETNQPISLQVRVRDEAFAPADNTSVAIEVHEPGGERVRLTVVPSTAEGGLFEAMYVPRVSGGYLAKVTVTDAAGTQIGDAHAGWAVDLEAREFQSIRANRPLLEKIARQTGGRVVEMDQLDDFARSLSQRKAPVMETWIRPVWDLPGALPATCLFILACFAAEWAIRRWKGLP